MKNFKNSINGNEVYNLMNLWQVEERWTGIYRPYSAEDVIRLRPSLHIEYSIARHGARRMWEALKK
jgi:isocitrate lyase